MTRQPFKSLVRAVVTNINLAIVKESGLQGRVYFFSKDSVTLVSAAGRRLKHWSRLGKCVRMVKSWTISGFTHLNESEAIYRSRVEDRG